MATGSDALLQQLQARAARQLSASERQAALVSKLEDRAVAAPLVEGGPQGRRTAQFIARAGHAERAHDFLGQLNRIDEAQRVLDLAWQAGEFEDCLITETTVFTHKGDRRLRLDPEQIEESKVRVKARALEILAEQYPDLRVRVIHVAKWRTQLDGIANWCKVLGGPEDGAQK